MASRARTANGTGNRILDALPADDFAALEGELQELELAVRDQIYQRGEPIEHVHFPIDCVISLLSEMADGRAVEVATVGREGMAGIPVFLQAAYTSAHEAFCQVPGRSLRLGVDVFSSLSNSGGSLHTLLQRYTQALFTQIAQSSACNRLHTIEQRCARWLLQTHDRVGKDEFSLTQEFLAQMLGVRRTSVTEVAQQLQERDLIRYSRGTITIEDRQGLEDTACECYDVVREEQARLLGEIPLSGRR